MNFKSKVNDGIINSKISKFKFCVCLHDRSIAAKSRHYD